MTKYNLSRFNISGHDEQEIEIRFSCSETIEASVASYSNISLEVTGSEDLRTRSICSGSTKEFMNLLAKLNIDSKINSACILNLDIEETLKIKPKLAQDIYILEENSEKIKIDPYGSENIKFFEIYNEKTEPLAVFVGKNLYSYYDELFENLMINTNSLLLREEIANIRITLNPGERLMIDTDRFTVEVDGINYFNKYDGDWPKVDRSSEKIVISANNGARLEGKIIYMERFL